MWKIIILLERKILRFFTFLTISYVQSVSENSFSMTRRIFGNLLSQQKVFYCYVVLSLWIFTIIVGLYKYLGAQPLHRHFVSHEKREILTVEPDFNVWISETRFKKVLQSCAPIESILLGNEKAVVENFTLEGIVVLFRHGDRGPINYVRNLNSMNCDYVDLNSSYTAFVNYTSFISSQWSNQTNPLYQYFGIPNIHFPLPMTKRCEIGQLTTNGIRQHLKLGSLLRSTYFGQLFTNVTSINSNIFSYSTKYRRTFQSLNAFLYGFLRETFHRIPLRIVSSMFFCFEDCACPAIEMYSKAVILENSKRLKSHPAMLKLVEDISSVVYTMSDGSFTRDPHYLKDALLTYICHNKQLPCTLSKCVYPEHVTRVFSYIDWDTRQYAKSSRRQKMCILGAYGFIKNILSHMLKMVSNERPKMVVYSAHDKTMTYLLTTLGIISNEAVSPPYASRAIFEVYLRKQPNNSSVKKFFFRFVFNGKDLTRRIKFCKDEKKLEFTHNSLLSMCSFESLIRFLHEDYFSMFETANFKDACTSTKRNL